MHRAVRYFRQLKFFPLLVFSGIVLFSQTEAFGQGGPGVAKEAETEWFKVTSTEFKFETSFPSKPSIETMDLRDVTGPVKATFYSSFTEDGVYTMAIVDLRQLAKTPGGSVDPEVKKRIAISIFFGLTASMEEFVPELDVTLKGEVILNGVTGTNYKLHYLDEPDSDVYHVRVFSADYFIYTELSMEKDMKKNGARTKRFASHLRFF
jgi:hypothetical protein